MLQIQFDVLCKTSGNILSLIKDKWSSLRSHHPFVPSMIHCAIILRFINLKLANKQSICYPFDSFGMLYTLIFFVYSRGSVVAYCHRKFKKKKQRLHANHRKTDVYVGPKGLTVCTANVQGMRVGSAVHFSLGLLLQNLYRGYMPLNLLALFHCILQASGRSGMLCLQPCRQRKFIQTRFMSPSTKPENMPH